MAAVMAPVAVGAKWPWTVQAAPTASVVPQELAKTNCDAFVPVTAMLVMVSVAAPVLVMVTVCEPLMVPTVTLLKDRLAGDSVTGVAAATPLPVNAMVCGDVVALSVMVTLAVIAPTIVGWKWPWMVHVAPTARVAPQLLAMANCEAFVPVTAMLVKVSAAVPVLVKTTDCDALQVPVVAEPKAML